jgi:hypothetical protein
VGSAWVLSVAPSLSATLEWLKAVSGKHLPTNFEEMELDVFGHHVRALLHTPLM